LLLYSQVPDWGSKTPGWDLVQHSLLSRSFSLVLCGPLVQFKWHRLSFFAVSFKEKWDSCIPYTSAKSRTFVSQCFVPLIFELLHAVRRKSAFRHTADTELHIAGQRYRRPAGGARNSFCRSRNSDQ